MSERDIQNRILLECSRGDTRLFRNNVALGWAGDAQQIRHAGAVQVRPGDVVIRSARPLHAGLCKGSSDLIGWRSVEITPYMVGQRVAVFASVEVKTHTGKVRLDQENWQNQVTDAGGLAFIARSPQEAAEFFATR